MKALLRFVLGQHVLVNLSFFLLMLVGVFALFNLPIERYPNVQMGKVIISTYFPGASPEEVEALVTREIEDALQDLEYVEFIQSSSYRQRSTVTVKFLDDTDYAALYDELRLKVLGMLGELPESVDPPTFEVINVKNWLPTVMINLVGDRSNRALTLMAEEMKIPLKQIPGVEEVELQGEYVREYHIWLDPRKLDRFGVTFDDAARALTEANVSVPAGDFADTSGEYVVVVDERFRTRQQVAETIVRRDADGSFVTVGELMSDARVGYRDPFVIASVNGRDAVSLKIIKTDAGNALDIVPAVKRVLDSYQERLDAENVEVVLTQDQRITIDDSISTLGYNLLVGIGLVALLIWLFMGVRNAALTTIGIPFAFLVTMVLMYLTNNSLNEITLFSFVLVTGIIVDDAIVVLENIYRHLQEGRPIREAVLEGAAEVAGPVIAATATTVAAFLPMLIMSGSTGEFFAQVPIAVTFALIASLIECLLFLPPHFLEWPGAAWAEREARQRGVHAAQEGGKGERRIMRAVRAVVNRLVQLTMRFRFTSLGLVLLAFVAAIAILGLSISGRMPLVKIKFFPDEYNQYWVDLQGPIATPIEATSARLNTMAEYLAAQGGSKVAAATAQAGLYVNEDYEPVYGSNYGNIVVELPVKAERRFDDWPENDPQVHLEAVRADLERFAGDGWRILVRPEKGGPPTGKDVNIRAVGSNPESVKALAAEMHRFLATAPDIAPHLLNLDDDQGQPSRVYRFRVDRERAAEYGLTPAQVAGLAGSVLDGRYIGEFRTPDEDIDLKLRVDPVFLDSPEASLPIPLVSHASGPVRLGDLASVESYLEPGKINRYQNNRSVAVTANLKPGAPTSTPAIVNAAREHYAAVAGRYPGAELTFGGEFETTQRSYASLTYAFAVAVLIIYLILATQFKSYTQPLIILSAVVFSLIGVVFGKLVTQSLFTVNSFIATVGVTGVVVNDSLVLVDFINRAYRAGKSRREAILEGIRIRLRPILLTTLTTSLGLLPMALGIPSYSLVWGGMASTFVTGLAMATFLTLFIVPILWDLLTGAQERLARWRARRVETASA